MSRKEFIESLGATCQNWNWSWSFVNDQDKFVIFGAWDVHTKDDVAMILGQDWEYNRKGHKNKGYHQALEHLRLVQSEGYCLKTFPMIHSDEREGDDGDGPAKIKEIVREVSDKELAHVNGNWYAIEKNAPVSFPDETSGEHNLVEGSSETVLVNVYERNGEARQRCLDHYGYQCIVCTFDFEAFYGDIGKNYIHVHHLRPLSEIREEYVVDPIVDLVPICPNCHAIVHRSRKALGIEELKNHLLEIKTSRKP